MNATLPLLTVDVIPDANGHAVIRRHDGTPNGDTTCEPIATVYVDAFAPILAAAPALLAALDNLQNWVDLCFDKHADAEVCEAARKALAIARGVS